MYIKIINKYDCSYTFIFKVRQLTFRKKWFIMYIKDKTKGEQQMKFMRTMLEEKGLMDEILEFEENGVNNTMPIEG